MVIPTGHFWGAGSLQWFYGPKLIMALTKFGATQSLATVGALELNLRTVTEHPQNFDIPGVVNITPDVSRIRRAGGFRTDRESAMLSRPEWERVIVASADRVIRVEQKLRIRGAEALFKEGMHTGHDVPARVFLSRIHERDASLDIVASSVIPEQYAQRPKAVIGYELYHELQADGVVLVTILTDNDGPFAHAYTLDEADKFQATTEAALIGSPSIFGRNKTLAEIGRTLRPFSPFAGMAFWSRPLEGYRERAGDKLRRLFAPKSSLRLRVDAGHVVTEAMHATDAVVNEPTARAIEDGVDLALPSYAIYIVPLDPRNRDAWVSASNAIRRDLKVRYPTITPVFCPGPGVPDPRYDGDSWLQVSLIYPLPPVPSPIKAFLPKPTAEGNQAAPGEQPASHELDPSASLIASLRAARNGKER